MRRDSAEAGTRAGARAGAGAGAGAGARAGAGRGVAVRSRRSPGSSPCGPSPQLRRPATGRRAGRVVRHSFGTPARRRARRRPRRRPGHRRRRPDPQAGRARRRVQRPLGRPADARRPAPAAAPAAARPDRGPGEAGERAAGRHHRPGHQGRPGHLGARPHREAVTTAPGDRRAHDGVAADQRAADDRRRGRPQPDRAAAAAGEGGVRGAGRRPADLPAVLRACHLRGAAGAPRGQLLDRPRGRVPRPITTRCISGSRSTPNGACWSRS